MEVRLTTKAGHRTRTSNGVGIGELQRDLARLQAKEGAIGQQLANADALLKYAEQAGDEKAVSRLSPEVENLTMAYRSAISDANEIRDAMHQSGSYSHRPSARRAPFTLVLSGIGGAARGLAGGSVVAVVCVVILTIALPDAVVVGQIVAAFAVVIGIVLGCASAVDDARRQS